MKPHHASLRNSIIAAVTAVALSACASTKLVREWSDPGYQGPPYRKFLIMGVSDDGGMRRTFEDHFVKHIQERGAEAYPSCRFIPQDGRVPREVVAQAVEKSGAKAVLLTRLVGRKELSQVYEGSPQFSAGEVVVQDLHSTYSVFWAGFHPSTQETFESVWTLETKAFDAKRQTLVWDGFIELTNPDSVVDGSHDLALAVVKAMVKRKMIP